MARRLGEIEAELIQAQAQLKLFKLLKRVPANKLIPLIDEFGDNGDKAAASEVADELDISRQHVDATRRKQIEMELGND